MPPHTPTRRTRTARRLGTAVTALALLVPVGATQASAQPDQSTVPGKTFAAYEYGWHPVTFVDHFNESLESHWDVAGTGTAGTQNGMFTMESAESGSVGVTLRAKARDRGRWEVRLRARRYETAHRNYTVAAELIPAGQRSQNCGARNIGLATFKPSGSSVKQFARTLPKRAFTTVKKGVNLSNDYWHTYAVEVTPRRISWFVDGKVRATETRKVALSGVPLTLRLQLQAAPGTRMNRTRLQVDTVRYFTLRSPNKKSTRAPLPKRRTFRPAC